MDIVKILLMAYVIAHLSIHFLLIFFKVLFRLYHGGNKTIAKLLVIPFVIADFLVNVYSITLIYKEPPKWGEWLVTARLKRWKKLPKSVKGNKRRRRDFAWRMCEELNQYDPQHC